MNIRINTFLLIFSVGAAHAQAAPAAQAASGNAPITMDRVVVATDLDRVRENIVPSLGASLYEIASDQIAAQSQGLNAPFNQVLLRVPGMVQDSFGQLHLRGEHANLQYRINDVLLPEGISGFGQELDTRFLDSVSVLTGSLPAQYGYRTAGVIDIHTKNGALAKNSDVSAYGGSFDSIRPSFETGGTAGDVDYYVTGSYYGSNLGVENPTGSRSALHDRTRQFKGFGYFSYLIDKTSRLNLIVSGSTAKFQIPNNPDQDPAFTLNGVPSFDSTNLNENQRENNAYAILAYQKTTDAGGVQLSAFTRLSSVKFSPDPAGDLIFNGVASRVKREIFGNGVEADGRWSLGDVHTLRGGLLFTANRAKTDNTDAVFAIDADGNQTSTMPLTITDNQRKNGYLYSAYVQDEWKVSSALTVNYGLRADEVNAFLEEGQLSPRLNVVFAPTENTSVHAGYARYFTPPPLELIRNEDIAKFDGTTNEPEVSVSSAVRSERADYFDLGITQKLSKEFSLGIDGYYKRAKNQLDEGQFGQALVFSPFNYARGKVYGVELSSNYSQHGFSAYGNFAISRATGRDIASGEFQFGQDELDYIAMHNVHLDHEQHFTASGGLSYKFEHTLIYADFLYGSGLRRGFANTQKLPSYDTFNFGIEQTFPLAEHQQIKLRFDVVNLFDKVYELRDGSGIGVGAPQFGTRRGFFGGVTWSF